MFNNPYHLFFIFCRIYIKKGYFSFNVRGSCIKATFLHLFLKMLSVVCCINIWHTDLQQMVQVSRIQNWQLKCFSNIFNKFLTLSEKQNMSAIKLRQEVRLKKLIFYQTYTRQNYETIIILLNTFFLIILRNIMDPHSMPFHLDIHS